jgi:DNA-binding beta-propeller fold protein YncE
MSATIGTSAGGPGQLEFRNPSALACDYEGNLVVADTDNHRVVKLDARGGFLWSVGGSGADGLPRPGTAQGEFSSPQAICTDTDNNVYVADTRNSRVQKLSPDGDFITVFGAWGALPGMFGGDGPVGIAVDDRGFVLVSDSHTASGASTIRLAPGGNFRVQRFDPDGDFVGQFGSYGTGPGQFGGAAPIREYGFDYGPGIGPGPIGPTGIAVNTNTDHLLERNTQYGDIFVADCDNDRVQVFQGTEIPKSILGAGVVHRPRQACVDSQDRLYVSGVHRHEPLSAAYDINDPLNWRIEPEYRWVWILDTRGWTTSTEMYGPYGTVLGGLGTREAHDAMEHRPGATLHSHGYGLAVSRVDDSIVYVQGENRILKFKVDWGDQGAVR